MTTIDGIAFLRHISASPATHVLHFRSGRLARSQPGAAFWYRPLTTTIALVPTDDRELDLVMHCRTLDFQDVLVQGVVTYRVADPELLASRIDFTIDVHTGAHDSMPLEQLGSRLRQAAQQHVLDHVAARPLRTVLAEGVDVIRGRIVDGLGAGELRADLGIELVGTRVSSLAPESDVAAALQMPTREAIQQQADEATFQRRALAVDKERAIEENELANRIELARRGEQLVAREGANRRLESTEQAAAARIDAEAEARRIELLATARNAAEREQVEIFASIEPAVLMALAAREAAGNLPSIEHLVLAPDSIGPAIAALARRSA
jgi:regulator of protease activity HflC (stomatin/prohibitin superfamily)